MPISLAVFALMLCCTTSAFAQSRTPEETSTRIVQLSLHGWVDYRDCTAPVCAGIGDPYRYNVYPAEDINSAAVRAISSLGFSFKQYTTPPPFPECDAAAEKQKNASFKRFWTDYVTLNDDELAKMGLSWRQLGIAADDSLVYQFRIVGCYYTDYDGSVIPFTDPKAAFYSQFNNPYNPSYRTEVTVILKVDAQSRARKSAFLKLNNPSISPKPFLDVIAASINDSVNSVPVTRYSSDSSGNVMN